MLEGWTTLAFVAGQTQRLKLGTLVTGVTYRYPGVLIKTATTLDVLSRGRSYFGVGAAWNEFEHVILGIPFPPVTERFAMLEDVLQLAHRMWAGNTEPFTGQHYQLPYPLNVPNAIQRPHPPILVDGAGSVKPSSWWLAMPMPVTSLPIRPRCHPSGRAARALSGRGTPV
jgi:alkanesulfonate monooxygenase SsuD/methylene tetrahydromethanopterin reductase-like flavin-dependent oxidoreductase (luciferase family)